MRNLNNIRSKQFRLNNLDSTNMKAVRCNRSYPFAFEILKAVQSNQHALNLNLF